MRIQALGGALLLSCATLGVAQEQKPTDTGKEQPKPMFTFAMHGFTSGSVWMQDAALGPSGGQQALYVQQFALHQPVQDRMSFGGDVRQSRFNWSVAGPNLPAFGNAIPRGVLEIDFFGNFGSGNYGDVSLVPRMRLAYGELDWGGGNRIQFGQNLDLIFAIAPASLAHIAFPYSYGSGNIGWRRPGVFGWHTFGDKKGMNLEFAWEVGRSQWADSGQVNQVATAPNSTGNGIGQGTVGSGGDPYGFGLGEASGLPAVEARLTLAEGTTWQVHATGHWQRADRSGVGQQVTATFTPGKDIDTIAGEAGTRMKFGPLSFSATGFVGKNLAPLVGNFQIFQANNIGDIHAKGGWVQAGFNFTPQLSLWGYIGAEVPNEADAIAAGMNKVRNVTTAGMLQYRDSVKVANIASDYAIGIEWIHFNTRLRTVTAGVLDPALSGDVGGNQWILSGNYFF